MLATAATVAPVLVQHFQYSFLLDTTLTLAQAKRSRRRNEELLLPAAAPCCGCCCSAVACSSAPMRWPVPSRVPQSLPLLLPLALATASLLFVFVNFDLFAAYFALCATGTSLLPMQIDFAKNDLRPVQVDVVVVSGAAVVVVIAVCQPISIASVFWQVNMRFSKYFCMLCVVCCVLSVERIRRVCLPFAQTCIIFYTLWNSVYALIKSTFTLLHMQNSLVKEIGEQSSNGHFFISENLSHLTKILFYIFSLIFSLFLYNFTAYVFVEHSSWWWPTYLAFFSCCLLLLSKCLLLIPVTFSARHF